MTPVACRAKMVAVELRENDLLQNLTAMTLPVAVELWENDLLRHLTAMRRVKSNPFQFQPLEMEWD